MALGVTDLRKGAVFSFEGTPYRVTEYSQKVVGRGGSIVNVTIKSLLDGRVLQKTFKGNEQLDSVDLSYSNIQYLYNDGAKYYFMDNESYEQIELASDILEEQTGYLKEGDIVKAMKLDGNTVSIELPKNVYLEVTYSEDVVKGDTTSSVLKDATLETGIVVKVPAFIKQGDVISVDTETGSYRERKKGLRMNVLVGRGASRIQGVEGDIDIAKTVIDDTMAYFGIEVPKEFELEFKGSSLFKLGSCNYSKKKLTLFLGGIQKKILLDREQAVASVVAHEALHLGRFIVGSYKSRFTNRFSPYAADVIEEGLAEHFASKLELSYSYASSEDELRKSKSIKPTRLIDAGPQDIIQSLVQKDAIRPLASYVREFGAYQVGLVVINEVLGGYNDTSPDDYLKPSFEYMRIARGKIHEAAIR